MSSECICTWKGWGTAASIWGGHDFLLYSLTATTSGFSSFVFFEGTVKSRYSFLGGFNVVSGVSPVEGYFKECLCCFCIAQMQHFGQWSSWEFSMICGSLTMQAFETWIYNLNSAYLLAFHLILVSTFERFANATSRAF